MELSTVLYTVAEHVATISLNRTKAMNALNKQIFVDLTTAFEAALADAEVRCVILKGEGRCFCAGGDIAEMVGITDPDEFAAFIATANNFSTLLNGFAKPVIAAAHGAIAGAGTSLVMHADIAVVADNAMFIVAFGQVGLVPDCGCNYLLPRAVGPNIAKELMLTQRAVKADEMKTLGLANKVVAADALMDEAMKLAKKIAKGPINAYGLSKAMMNKAHESTLKEILDDEGVAQTKARTNFNGGEGLTAFLEKRPAQFQ
ncbi:MAG: enoyl-CoA hydratase/isomerase family protein [Evtepia sp.]